MTQTGFPAMVA